MEKMVERLGLYDIWTTLFPGMIFAGGIKTLCDYMLKILQRKPYMIDNSIEFQQLKIFYPTDIYGLFSFIVVSYLCGHILHELSSMAKQHIIYRKGKPTELLLEKKSKVLNSQQIQMYNQVFLKLNGNQKYSEDDFEKRRKESQNIFNIMNTELQSKGISSRYVKLNLIYNMCFTVCMAILLMLMHIFVFVIYQFIKHRNLYISELLGIVIALMAVFLVLYLRGNRYYIYWVRNIVVSYNNSIQGNG